MSFPRGALSVLRRLCLGSPVLVVMALALVASSLASPLPLTPLTPATVASRGSATTERQSLAAAIQDRVAEGIDARRTDLTPFDLVGVSWADGPREPVRVRVRTGDTWGEWRELEAEGDDAPDPGSVEARQTRVVSLPVWVGGADGYEIDVAEGVEDVAVHLVRDDPEPAPGEVMLAAAADGGSGAPPIAFRSSWDAREPAKGPTIAPQLKMGFVHHTVSTNDYTAADVPAMLRGIQAYHMDVNGWDDIGYNFLVDRFGGMWEGRAGGIARNVVGAHAAGFNTSSVGVAVLGDFRTAAPTSAAVTATGRLLGWRLKLAGVDPEGSATMAEGEGTRRFEAIAGHRDAAATECPGEELFARLSTIRAEADAVPAPVVDPPVDTARACPPGRVPAAGFVDVGDGNVHHGAVDCLALVRDHHRRPGRATARSLRARAAGATGADGGVHRPGARPGRPRAAGRRRGRVPCPSNPALGLAADHPHADAVRRLAQAGVVAGGVGGAPDDCFGPELDVRRDQMASFLHRALELATGDRLRREGMAVDVAHDGESALDKAAVNGYEVILLDRDLPVVHGDEVCRTLADDRSPARILMLTASAEVDQRVEGLGLGADDYLGKPFAFAELVARVRALGRRAQAPRPPVLSSGRPHSRSGAAGRHPCGSFLVPDPQGARRTGGLARRRWGGGQRRGAGERVWDEHADPFTNTVRVTMVNLRRNWAILP